MYALLHVFLPCHDCFLPDVEAHLGRLVVHEASEVWGEGAPLLLLGAAHLAGVGAVAVVGAALGRRWGAHHWDGGDMLGDGVVERRGVRWRWVEGASLHILLRVELAGRADGF